jgi:hypothetical protein
MTDLPDPGAVRELKDLRAEVTGCAPAELHRARGLLLAEIAAERGTGDSSHPTFPPRAASRPRRWLRPVLLGATAAVAIAALTVSLLPGRATYQARPRASSPAATPPPSAPASSPPPAPAVLTAAYVLNRAASTASSSSRPVPRPGQFIYVSSVGTGLVTDMDPSGGRSWLYKSRGRSWESVDGQRAGLLQEVGGGYVKLPDGPVAPADRGIGTSWISLPPSSCPGAVPARDTYEFQASLPTDPSRLRTWIYRHLNGQNAADTQAWIDIGDMLRGMLVPAKLAAALYRVAAMIPGVTAVPRAVNAVGRVGVAVSRSGSALIFDPQTYQLIGESVVLTKAVPGQGLAGTVVGSSAELQVKVVDHLPDIPSSQVFKSGGGAKC